MLFRTKLSIFGMLSCFLIASHAEAATGTISVVNGINTLAHTAKSSNISGPGTINPNQTGHFTATFPNLTNATGSIDTVVVEDECVFTFTTKVTGTTCAVTLSTNNEGPGGCASRLQSVNASTCDFSGQFTISP